MIADNDFSYELYFYVQSFQTWIPRYVGYQELINAVDLHDGFHYLPAIWSGNFFIRL